MSLLRFDDRAELTYTSCYCEENTWLLCQKAQEQGFNIDEDCAVLFISNAKKQVMVLQQRSGDPRMGGMVIWDYHVVFLQRQRQDRNLQKQEQPTKGGGWYVFDFDTRLPFPCPWEIYRKAFPTPELLHREYHHYLPTFRVATARNYLENFASDRHHMIDHAKSTPERTVYMKDPPTYPCIQPTNHGVQERKIEVIAPDSAARAAGNQSEIPIMTASGQSAKCGELEHNLDKWWDTSLPLAKLSNESLDELFNTGQSETTCKESSIQGSGSIAGLAQRFWEFLKGAPLGRQVTYNVLDQLLS